MSEDLPGSLVARRGDRHSLLGSIVLQLSSDNDGTLTAAARALQRLLSSSSTDIHALVDHIESAPANAIVRPAARQQQAAASDDDEPELPDGYDEWISVARSVRARKARLDGRHHGFADDMVKRLTERRYVSTKQLNYLSGLFWQLGYPKAWRT